MKLLLLGTAREKSTRIKHKMIRPFAESSLYQIYLSKFEAIVKTKHPFDNIGMAINRSEKTLWKLSRGTTVPIIERGRRSTQMRKRAEELYFLKDRKEDYVMWVNGCFPFLKLETIIKTAVFFKSNKNRIKSLTAVRKKYNWYWHLKTGRPINNKNPRCVSTQKSPPILETIHCFHIFDRKHLLKTNSYWNLKENDPYLYLFKNSIEFLDIDEELDFKVCEALWKRTK